MQMYPSGGGYKEHYYAAVEEDYIIKEDCRYNRGSSMQMMKPDHCTPPPPNHNYNQIHGYGGYNDHNKNGREGYNTAQYSETGCEEERRADTWDIRNDYSGHAGKHLNAHEYSGSVPHNNVGMKHSEYEAHQGHRVPHGEHHQHYSEYPEERKRVQVWEYKGIRD